MLVPAGLVADAVGVAVRDELVEALARRLLRGPGRVVWVSAPARQVLAALRPGAPSASDAEIEDHELLVLYTQNPVPIRKRPPLLPGRPKPQARTTAAFVEVRDRANGGGLVMRLWFTTLNEQSAGVLTAMASLGPLATVEVTDQPPETA